MDCILMGIGANLLITGVVLLVGGGLLFGIGQLVRLLIN